MTDFTTTDDLALETSATDIRVFGKWSGAEVQISDMSLEVNFIHLICAILFLLLSSRITF
jgi:hypothetical protein